MGEAIALVGKAGVDRSAYVELLTSSIFPAPIYRTYGDLIASSRFQPAGFPVNLRSWSVVQRSDQKVKKSNRSLMAGLFVGT